MQTKQREERLWTAIFTYTRRTKLAQIFTQILNDCVSRNDRRINTTEINQMIFIEDSLFYLMKSKYAIFSNIKVTKVERSAFGGTYYRSLLQVNILYHLHVKQKKNLSVFVLREALKILHFS